MLPAWWPATPEFNLTWQLKINYGFRHRAFCMRKCQPVSSHPGCSILPFIPDEWLSHHFPDKRVTDGWVSFKRGDLTLVELRQGCGERWGLYSKDTEERATAQAPALAPRGPRTAQSCRAPHSTAMVWKQKWGGTHSPEKVVRTWGPSPTEPASAETKVSAFRIGFEQDPESQSNILNVQDTKLLSTGRIRKISAHMGEDIRHQHQCNASAGMIRQDTEATVSKTPPPPHSSQ